MNPHERQSHLEFFAPPSGMALSAALITTYGLDFVVLAGVLRALVGNEDDKLRDDPVQLLRAIHALQEKVAVITAKGGLRATAKEHNSRLYSLCSPFVREARLAHHTFHPKIAFLLYHGERTRERSKAHLRVLCGSRNLTKDRHWELVFVLDGDTPATKSPFGLQLADAARKILTHLPSPSPGLRALPEQLEHFHSFPEDERKFGRPQFHLQSEANGFEGFLSEHAPKRLVMSPFLGDTPVEKLCNSTDELTIISTQEALDGLSDECASRLPTKSTFVVDPFGTSEGEPTLSLHAKMMIEENGSSMRALVGSANLTAPGWAEAGKGNWEAIVELRRGIKIKTIVDEFLSRAGGNDDGTGAFSPWILQYRRSTGHALDDLQAKLENRRQEDERRQAVSLLELRGFLDEDEVVLRLGDMPADKRERALAVLSSSAQAPEVTLLTLAGNHAWFDARALIDGREVRIPVSEVASLTDLVLLRWHGSGGRGGEILLQAEFPDLARRRKERLDAVVRECISPDKIENLIRGALRLPTRAEQTGAGNDEDLLQPGDEADDENHNPDVATGVPTKAAAREQSLRPICFEDFLEAFVRSPESLLRLRPILAAVAHDKTSERWLDLIDRLNGVRQRREDRRT